MSLTAFDAAWAGFILACALACFVGSRLLERRLRRRFGSESSVAFIVARRVSGGVLLGLVPAALAALVVPDWTRATGLARGPGATTLVLTAALTAFVIWSMKIASRRASVRAEYPEIRARVWSSGLIVLNVTTWAFYMLGYEYVFRGFVLFPLAARCGWPLAVIASSALYVATHVGRPRYEIVTSALIAPALAGLALGGGFFCPYVVHLSIALSVEFVARRAHVRALV